MSTVKKSALNPTIVYTTDRFKAVVPVLSYKVYRNQNFTVTKYTD